MFYILLDCNHSGHVEVILYILQNGYHFGELQIMFYSLCHWNYLRLMKVMLYILHNWSHKTLLGNNLNQSIVLPFRCGTYGIHKIPPPHSILGDTLDLCPGLFYSFSLFKHRFSPRVLRSPSTQFSLGFHSRACLVISSISFRSVWPSHPHLHFLICKSILGCLVRFHSSLFVIWSGQKILSTFLKLLLIKTCSLVVIYYEFFQVSQP